MVTDRSGCPRGHGHDAVEPDRDDIDVAHRMSGGGLEVHRHPSAVRAWVERTWVEADVHRHRASAWRDRNDFDTGRRAEEPARGDGGADSGQRVHLDHAVKEVRNDDVAAGVDGDGAGQDRAAREEDRLPPRHRTRMPPSASTAMPAGLRKFPPDETTVWAPVIGSTRIT